MFQHILALLGQNGWEIQFCPGGWAVALDEHNNRGLALLQHRNDSENESLGTIPARADFPQGLKWQAIALCSNGVDSHLLKKVPRGMQFWFWDLEKGRVFPYPATRDVRMYEWLRQVGAGHYTEPPWGPESLRRGKFKRLPFIPGAGEFVPVMTYLLIAAILIVFALMTWAGGSTNMDILVAYGAKVDSLISAGQVWRLLSANFIHIGFIHLAFNLYALWVIGPMAEKLLGHWVYLGLYLLSGIGGNFASYLFSPALSAGASAAIFGLLGALLFYSWRQPGLWRTGLGVNLVVIIAVNLVLGLIQPEIDNFAHLGGLLSGFLLGGIWHTGHALSQKEEKF